KIDIACQPATSFIDGHFLISWKDATVTFKRGSNYTILYSTNNNLPLNSWNSLETNNPSQTYLPNFVPGQKYYIRMKVAYPDGNHFIICDTTTVLPPIFNNVTVINFGLLTFICLTAQRVIDYSASMLLHNIREHTT
uniref:Fibronectin type-III domain-containing protein n=1 Tax=Romanomermis culicivorax TaxID=13658 RepID=A0A915IM91_ROMCU